jgi:hypothetical protein
VDINVLATGEDDVTRYLAARAPDFAVQTLLDLACDHPGRWPAGTIVDEASTSDTIVVITWQDGIYRIESGPADDYFDDGDWDEEEEEDT